MPRHVCDRKFPTLEIWKSPDKFTGKRKTQIIVYVYIYTRSLFRSARLGWRRLPSWTNYSVTKKTRITVGKPIRILSRDRPPLWIRQRQLRKPAPPRPNQNSPSYRGGGGDDLLIPPPLAQRGVPPPTHPRQRCTISYGGAVTSASRWYR